MHKVCLFIIFTFILCNNVNSELSQYFKSLSSYFGYDYQEEQKPLDDDILSHNVPYELSIADEKFISEAAKLTGVDLSELDSCQQGVVLKLQSSCDKLNDEQLAKLAVMLLNCQSKVEGRKIYPCTDTMNIKDCTSSMDADVWNSYHLMSNRVRAVCYSIRQIQFRGLAEYTINRLMNAARDQLFSLEKISKDQEKLQEITQRSLHSIAQGQVQLAEQQNNLQMAQLHSQFAIEDNLRKLADKRRLIAETHHELTKMTYSVQDKLKQTASELKKQTDETRVNHQEVLDDLIVIQDKIQTIFQQIEEASTLLLKQNEIAHQHYDVTVIQLAEVNATIHSLLHLVSGTKKALEECLVWISTALGGTDLAIERLLAILWHAGLLMLAMICCAFLNAQITTRLIVTALPSLNLVLTLQQSPYALGFIGLTLTIISFIFVHMLILFLVMVWQSKLPQQALSWIKQKLTSQKKNSYIANSSQEKNTYKIYESSQTENDTNNYSYTPKILSRNGTYLSRSRSRTPSLLNGATKNVCNATTRMGTQCKLSTLSGRNFCYRHQQGDSVYGD